MGVSQIRRPVKGGEPNWTTRRGGAKKFGLGQYFFKSLKLDFLCFWGVLGTFNFLVQGGRQILDASLGGANEIGRVIRGGERNRTVDIFGLLRGQILCCVK